jgi:RimJ/RimL family protein N-acetyltransferase
MELRTQRLRLELQNREEVEQMLAGMSDYDRAQVSPDWLARLRASHGPDPWTFPFRVLLDESAAPIGSCSFKGPPIDGIVEIAYGIDPDHQKKGYATEAAQALVDYAATRRDVRLILAHTLPEGIASKRVLQKCGFSYVGDVLDPEDGNVSRFEKPVVRVVERK